MCNSVLSATSTRVSALLSVSRYWSVLFPSISFRSVWSSALERSSGLERPIRTPERSRAGSVSIGHSVEGPCNSKAGTGARMGRSSPLRPRWGARVCWAPLEY